MAQKNFEVDGGLLVKEGANIGGNLAVTGEASVNGNTLATKVYVDGQISSVVAGSAGALDSLTDVDTTGVVSGNVLSYDGTNWVAGSGGGASYTDADVAAHLNGNLDGHIIPDTNSVYDLGSPEKKFRHLYLSDSTIYMGTADNTIRTQGTALLFNGADLQDYSLLKNKPSIPTDVNQLTDVDSLLSGTGASSAGGDFSDDVDMNLNALNNAVLNPNPESNLSFAPYLVNDLAFARLRGSIYTSNDTNLSDEEFDRMFDGSASFWSIESATTGDTEATATTVTVFTPTELLYGTRVGVAFGSLGFRARGVHLEAYSNGVWKTVIYTNSNEKDVLFGQVPANSNPGVSRVRLSVWDPVAGDDTIRVTHIFAHDYNSELAKSMFVARDGGDIYGDINAKSDVVIDGTLTVAGTTVEPTKYIKMGDTTFSTNDNNGNGSTYYKIGRFTIGGQYRDSNVIANTFLYSDGAGDMFSSRLEIGIRQGSPIGNDPLVSLKQHKFYEGSDVYTFGYEIVQNTPTVIVDLYVYVIGSWRRFGGAVVAQKVFHDSDSIEWYNVNNAGTTTQPTGWIDGTKLEYTTNATAPLIAGRLNPWAMAASTNKDKGLGYTAVKSATGTYDVTVNSGSLGTDYAVIMNTDDTSVRVQVTNRSSSGFTLLINGGTGDTNVSFSVFKGY